MKKTFIKLFIAAFALTALASCSHRLAGTWQVKRFEVSKPGEPGTSLNNIGTISFSNNGSGEKNISYVVLGVQREDKTPFKWEWADGKYVTIESEGSDFSKTWIIIENKKKSQKWKSTDGSNLVQTLEIEK
ncbi:MAG: hypothetical protein RBT35_07740 [Bacteroidales bacterium]|jgi:hypothetical protein|nr:hypothetical protein [Bacteroidales bacterium]